MTTVRYPEALIHSQEGVTEDHNYLDDEVEDEEARFGLVACWIFTGSFPARIVYSDAERSAETEEYGGAQ